MNSGTTDNEIINRVLRGENQLYADLVNRYQRYVFTLVLKYTDSREDAEEIAQDVFIKAYRALASFRGESKFSTWLYSIVHSTSLTFLRKKKPETRSLDNEKVFEAAEAKTQTAEPIAVEKKSRLEMISRAIRMLSEDDATIITLFYKAEQSLEEIASILNLETNAVKVRLHRARQRLKEKMEKHFPQEVKDINY